MIRRVSKSGIQVYVECPRKYYYQYLFDDVGYVNAQDPALDLLIGLGVHAGMATLLETGSGEEAIKDALKDYDLRCAGWEEDQKISISLAYHRNLIIALVWGWYYHHYENFKERYEILSIEKVTPVPLATNIELFCKADAVLRDRLSGHVYVLNWKTLSDTASMEELFTYDIQMWTEALATEGAIGEHVVGCIVGGFYKGYKRDGLYQNGLTLGWRQPQRDGSYLFAVERPTKQSKKEASWVRFETASNDYSLPTQSEGVQGWVEWLDPRSISKYWKWSEPLLKNDEVVEGWLAQQVRRESNTQYILETGSEMDKLEYFEQKCGKPCRWCPYKDPCFMQSDMSTLIKEGKLKPRERYKPMLEEKQA